ncbi:MAG: GNAT family N-acetyltransferase [Chloroflexota bacterium]|nr:MAG: GNAT family N-acetyltransferase [Chloroflexota bacterium]
MDEITDLQIHPLTPGRWQDLEALFGPRGAYGGCWCMWWRLTRSQFDQNRGENNRTALKEIVDSGRPPGLLAYLDGKPVAWCALAPREDYSALERSRVLKPVDDQPVWSITCFYVAKSYRRKGLTVSLLKAAVEYAASLGAAIVEGYPTEPRKESAADPYVYTGLASAFRKAGFVEVLRRSETRPIMRYQVKS